TTLTTLCQLLAPCIPFVTDVMWRNLKAQGRPSMGFEESVHLTDFPAADESLIDTQLCDDMESLLDLISLGLSARQAAKIMVRQPLAELRVSAGTDADRRAVSRFADLIREARHGATIGVGAGGDSQLGERLA